MSTDIDPIYSDLLQQEPELAELISQFIDALPGLIEGFARAIANEDWLAVQQLSHDMKGIGGGYGYPSLSELAGRMGQRASTGQFANLDSDLKEMKRLAQGILLGYQR